MKSYGEREDWLRRQREGRFKQTVEQEVARRAEVKRNERIPVTGDAAVVPNVVSRGRPLRSRKHMTLTALEPWRGYGMARSTWYRRKKGGTLPKVQQVGGWEASAELIAKIRSEDVS